MLFDGSRLAATSADVTGEHRRLGHQTDVLESQVNVWIGNSACEFPEESIRPVDPQVVEAVGKVGKCPRVIQTAACLDRVIAHP